ncbi:Glutaredoxin [Durusdinium trenchii]|uniref:Glutaredoxin n=1 Tax=Durusdinium trenchii TaxID=1381693 RepID=A0ABP0QJX0_9DINO
MATSTATATSPDVVVFSRPGCSFCAKAKALLSRRQVRFGVVDVGAEPERFAEATERGAMSTFPQILVGSKCLGGFDALKLLDEQGRLIEATQREPQDEVYIAPTPPEKIEMANLQYQAISPIETSAMKCCHFGRPALVSNAPGSSDPPAALPNASAEQLAVRGGDVNYVAMRQSAEWNLFRALASELGQLRLQSQLANMPTEERKAFFINIYNAMTFHGVTTFGRRSGAWYLYCFFITPAVSYRVAGTQLSLDDIEHGLLRAQPNYFEVDDQELQRKLRLPQVDPRIHMALNCGARSCAGLIHLRIQQEWILFDWQAKFQYWHAAW